MKQVVYIHNINNEWGGREGLWDSAGQSFVLWSEFETAVGRPSRSVYFQMEGEGLWDSAGQSFVV